MPLYAWLEWLAAARMKLFCSSLIMTTSTLAWLWLAAWPAVHCKWHLSATSLDDCLLIYVNNAEALFQSPRPMIKLEASEVVCPQKISRTVSLAPSLMWALSHWHHSSSWNCPTGTFPCVTCTHACTQTPTQLKNDKTFLNPQMSWGQFRHVTVSKSYTQARASSTMQLSAEHNTSMN